ncbi:MAG: hypothetical protein ACREKH_10925, partial [Candidatus Rokuibacteriota bacterium]
MRATACRPSALCALAGLVLLLGVRPAAAELIVSTVSPARHSIAQATDAVSVTFDRAVNPATVTNSTFRVFGRTSGSGSG